MNTPLRIGILGPGAVGGMLAALFWKQGDEVTCIAKPESTAKINARGIVLQSATFGTIHARPKAVPLLDHPIDILFITVKADVLSDALSRIPSDYLSTAIIVPLLNGKEHQDLLRQRFGERVLAATIGAVEVYRDTDGNCLHTNGSVEMTIGTDIAENQASLRLLSDVMTHLNVRCLIKPSEADVLWGKLSRLCPIAAATAAFQLPLGEIRAVPSHQAVLEQATRESTCVAQADGADIDPESVIRAIDALPAPLITSLARDVQRGHLGEADAIIGAVIRTGKQHKINCPNLEHLLDRIKERVGAIQ